MPVRKIIRKPEFLVLLAGLWIAATCNSAFWALVAGDATMTDVASLRQLLILAAVTVALICALMLILSVGPAVRPVLIVMLLACVPVGYFTGHLGILFDDEMLRNVLETNRAESFELLTPRMLAFVMLLGVLPALAIAFYPLQRRPLARALIERSVAIVVTLSLALGVFMANQKDVVSFVRNHRDIRYLLSPLNVLSASYSYGADELTVAPEFRHIAPDAVRFLAAGAARRPSVHVIVVGETARAASFSLGGYARETNPQLRERAVDYFSDVTACGTSTSYSLPCIFSLQGHADFDRDISNNQDNLLDIAARAGYQVYWADNGNSCKGVCARIASVNLTETTADNSLCGEDGCYDQVLVDELQRLVSDVTGDSLIVLHQLGSHGPGYHLRYPEKFRRFVPDCRSTEFSDCSAEEIVNAYDNTILYTDHIVARMIDILQSHAGQFDSTLLYVSDHGESLGEKGLYLHGMPYRIAPSEQLRVPMVSWSSEPVWPNRSLAGACRGQGSSSPISHDNVFHSMLGRMGITTSVYQPELDVLSLCDDDAVTLVSDKTHPLPSVDPADVPRANGG